VSAPAESGFVAGGDGVRLHWLAWGRPDAPVMLLLHGLRAYGMWFAGFAAAVQDRYRVVAIDQRGRGRSGWAPDGDYSRAAYVRDVEAVVAGLALPPFILVGHSMGGLNAMPYAARHPDAVRALVLVDIGPDLAPAGMQRIRRELGETPADFPSWEAARAFLRERHPRVPAGELATRLEWMLHESPAGRIGWRLDPAIFAPNQAIEPAGTLWQHFAGVRCPTLVVRGSETDLLDVETCERMTATHPDCAWVKVAGAGHMVLEDNLAGFNAAVDGFLRRFP
jgi:pimeloyl-ACP methyl ester carboxylesterase